MVACPLEYMKKQKHATRHVIILAFDLDAIGEISKSANLSTYLYVWKLRIKTYFQSFGQKRSDLAPILLLKKLWISYGSTSNLCKEFSKSLPLCNSVRDSISSWICKICETQFNTWCKYSKERRCPSSFGANIIDTNSDQTPLTLVCSDMQTKPFFPLWLTI